MSVTLAPCGMECVCMDDFLKYGLVISDLEPKLSCQSDLWDIIFLTGDLKQIVYICQKTRNKQNKLCL